MSAIAISIVLMPWFTGATMVSLLLTPSYSIGRPLLPTKYPSLTFGEMTLSGRSDYH